MDIKTFEVNELRPFVTDWINITLAYQNLIDAFANDADGLHNQQIQVKIFQNEQDFKESKEAIDAVKAQIVELTAVFAGLILGETEGMTTQQALEQAQMTVERIKNEIIYEMLGALEVKQAKACWIPETNLVENQ